MKSLFKKSVLGMIFIITIFGMNISAYAAEAVPDEFTSYLEQLKSHVPEIQLEECQKIVEIYDFETLVFLKFLEENFQNSSSTSSLANIAIVRYREYKKSLQATFAQLAPQAETSDDLKKFEVAYDNYSKCAEITDTYISLAKERMIEHIKNNASQKKTTMLLEKYHAINDRLRELNMAVAEMYSFFATFKNKLPGFLRECVTSP
ncbi:MAG: hypothetical protein ABIH78_04560 [Candidatus Peregrinibacteria bacterium]